MSTEQNKELATRMIEEIFNRGNVDKVDEFPASGLVEREELPPGLQPGREGVTQLALMMRSAFPDLKATIEDAVAEADKVVVRWTCAGTHSGDEFMGVPPTGKKVSVEVIDIGSTTPQPRARLRSVEGSRESTCAPVTKWGFRHQAAAWGTDSSRRRSPRVSRRAGRGSATPGG